MLSVNLKVIEGGRAADRGPVRQSFAGMHACEYCKCCSCKKVCTRCRMNCSPTDSYFIPVIACREFSDMREFEPVRYLYRSGSPDEYRISLPKPK